MDEQNMKKGKFYMKLNSLQQNPDDPSILDALFVIHDFEESGNGQVITEEVCNENKDYLVNKPIVCKYISKDENDGVDALTDHEEFIDIDRNTGEEFISTNTIAIGTFTDVYIGDFTDENDVTKKVLYGKAVLWLDKNRNICLLLDEWIDNGIVVPASVEYLYCNYNVMDGIEYIQSPIIYVAHALLNAEDRGDYEKVFPAYDSARLVSANMQKQWNKVVAQAIEKKGGEKKKKLINNNIDNKKNSSRKEGKNMDILKKVCEISKGDLKWKIFGELSKIMVAEDYNKMWISDYDLYDTYFIYESWNGEDYEYYKVNYTKNDETDEVTVDYENKTKVERTIKWEEAKNQLDTQAENIKTYKKDLNTKEDTIKTLNTDKKDLSTKLNEATTTIASLNNQLEDLKEVEKKYNKEKFEEALNSRTEEFECKFKGLNAIDKFNSDEVQELIKKSITDENSLISLNSMLVDLIPEAEEEKKKDDKSIKDFNTKEVKDLIPKDNSFESRYLA